MHSVEFILCMDGVCGEKLQREWKNDDFRKFGVLELQQWSFMVNLCVSLI